MKALQKGNIDAGRKHSVSQNNSNYNDNRQKDRQTGAKKRFLIPTLPRLLASTYDVGGCIFSFTLETSLRPTNSYQVYTRLKKRSPVLRKNDAT